MVSLRNLIDYCFGEVFTILGVDLSKHWIIHFITGLCEAISSLPPEEVGGIIDTAHRQDVCRDRYNQFVSILRTKVGRLSRVVAVISGVKGAMFCSVTRIRNRVLCDWFVGHYWSNDSASFSFSPIISEITV